MCFLPQQNINNYCILPLSKDYDDDGDDDDGGYDDYNGDADDDDGDDDDGNAAGDVRCIWG